MKAGRNRFFGFALLFRFYMLTNDICAFNNNFIFLRRGTNYLTFYAF